MIGIYIFLGVIISGLVILAFGPFVLSSMLSQEEEEREAERRKQAAEKPCAEVLIDGASYLLYPTKDPYTYRVEKKGIVSDRMQGCNHHFPTGSYMSCIEPSPDSAAAYQREQSRATNDPTNGVPA